MRSLTSAGGYLIGDDVAAARERHVEDGEGSRPQRWPGRSPELPSSRLVQSLVHLKLSRCVATTNNQPPVA